MSRIIIRINALFLLLALCIIAAGCTIVPMTGRRQLNLIPESELSGMSQQTYQEMLAKETLSNDPAQVNLVRGVGQNLAQATERYLQQHNYPTQRFEWEFNVIKDDDNANAWAMPGGKVAVYTGILPITQDETGLAVVMSHEIAHVIARHGNERMSTGLMVQMGGMALSEAMGTAPETTRKLLMTAYGAGAQVGAILPYSRLHEAEADRIGLVIMAMAGYDPREAVPFWQRMQEAGGARPPEFISTHPAPETRIEKLREYMPVALQYYQTAR